MHYFKIFVAGIFLVTFFLLVPWLYDVYRFLLNKLHLIWMFFKLKRLANKIQKENEHPEVQEHMKEMKFYANQEIKENIKDIQTMFEEEK